MNDALGSRLTATTLDLMRMASPSGEETRIADHVEARLRAAPGVETVTRHGNAVVARTPGDGPAVVLAGHLDTVPHAGHPEPALVGDDLVGLGGTDMKAALAVMLDLVEQPDTPLRPTALVFYDCEEVAYERNGLRPLFHREPWLTESPLALMLEPTANVLEVGCLGTLHARLTVRGEAAHSARPWLGVNAIHQAVPLLARIAAVAPRDVVDGPATFREVISVTLVEGGITRNVVPDHFTCNVNFRFAPDRDGPGAEAFLRELVGADAEVEIVDLAPSAPTRMDGGLLGEFARGLPVRAKQAWTDVAQFAAHGVPAANFGPGIPELAHRVDESVPVSNIVTCRDTLAQFLDGEDR